MECAVSRPLDTEQLRTTLDKIKRECNSFLSDTDGETMCAVNFAQWVLWRVEYELKKGWGE